VKSNYKNQFLIVIVLIITALTSCEEQSSIGVEVLPAGDLVTTKNMIQENIRSFTFSEDSIRTDEASNSLLGSFTDSIFGNTTIGFATQFRLYGFPEFGENPKADSVKLYLYYRIIYGDTTTYQKFNVYELETSLDVDSRYTQTTDLKAMTSGIKIGELEYKPKIKQDSTSKDTFYQLINIPLDISLGEKLINADSLQMINNDVFWNILRGCLLKQKNKMDGVGRSYRLKLFSRVILTGRRWFCFTVTIRQKCCWRRYFAVDAIHYFNIQCEGK
jgi:hypothetical protein